MNDSAVVVIIADEGDPELAKTRVCASVEEAESHVQSQVEAGVEESRIRVFSSTEMELRITLRPVVTIAQKETEADTDDHKDGDAKFSTMFRKA